MIFILNQQIKGTEKMLQLKKLSVILVLLISSNCYAKDDPFKPVQDLFAAMSAIDHARMKNAVTKDFQLLEAGEDWDMSDLIKVINPSEYKRRNFFNVVRTEISGNIAWMSYWNKATFTKGETQEAVAWLESAVMVKENEQWKIQMLHSTKIEAENIPKELKLTEYVE